MNNDYSESINLMSFQEINPSKGTINFYLILLEIISTIIGGIALAIKEIIESKNSNSLIKEK